MKKRREGTNHLCRTQLDQKLVHLFLFTPSAYTRHFQGCRVHRRVSAECPAAAQARQFVRATFVRGGREAADDWYRARPTPDYLLKRLGVAQPDVHICCLMRDCLVVGKKWELRRPPRNSIGRVAGSRCARDGLPDTEINNVDVIRYACESTSLCGRQLIDHYSRPSRVHRCESWCFVL
jgi:hypothetical protein